MNHAQPLIRPWLAEFSSRLRERAYRSQETAAAERGLTLGAIVILLGDLASGRRAGRERDDEITVCALTGVGVQDTAIALLAYSRARAQGLGTRFPAILG